MVSAYACKKLAKRQLSERRYKHTLNVAKKAVEYSEIYGVDKKRAEIAALLHDYMKEIPKSEMLNMLQENAIISHNALNRPQACWHGICASIWARNQLEIIDEEILSAIACHTCGKENMTDLEKIVFLADMTSEDRDYGEVDELRDICEKDLDKAMISALKFNLDHLQEEKKPVDENSVKALEFLKNQEMEEKIEQLKQRLSQ